MEEAYARALWQMVDEGMEHGKAVHALRELLVRQGREALLHRIGRAFVRLAERESRKSDLTLTIAREGEERHAKEHAKRVLLEMDVHGEDLKTKIDDTIIGGWRVEGRGVLVDASFKKQLLEMYNRATS